MKKPSYLALIIVLALVSMMILTGANCGGGTPESKPDLLPVNPGNWASFCDLDNGYLAVHIKNQGTVAAGPSTLEVDFYQYGQILTPIPSLIAGETITIFETFPDYCFDTYCGFIITVDSTGVIDESNELNNSQKGGCIG